MAKTAHYKSLLGALHAPQEETAAALASLGEGHNFVEVRRMEYSLPVPIRPRLRILTGQGDCSASRHHSGHR